MRVSASLMEDMPATTQVALAEALEAGARLYIEFGPLPAFERATLILVEHEGRRTELGNVSIRHGNA